MRPLERFPGPLRESPAEDVRQRLRDLPADLQPPYDWAEFRRRERAHRESPRRNAVKWEHAAAAAGVTVLIATMAMWAHSDHRSAEIGLSGIAAQPAESKPAGSSSGPDKTWMDELNAKVNALAQVRANEASLAAQAAVASQMAALADGPESQRWLEQQPVEPALVRVGPRLMVANLEDRIAWVDDALSDAQVTMAGTPGLRTLRQERARLVGSLAQVRYAETLAAQMP
jgi:hypothetical protein